MAAERNNKVVLRSLADNKERVIDSGRFPAVSPDGSYVAYVRTEHTEKAVAPNAKVAEDIDNVWVADTGGLHTKRRVTANFPHRFIEVQDWLKDLKNSGVP